MKPLKWESAEEIRTALEQLPDECKRQVTHVATNDPGRLLFLELQSVFPNLPFMSLDGLHMAYRLESALGGAQLWAHTILERSGLQMHQLAQGLRRFPWRVYDSADPPQSDLEETELRNDVAEGTMEPAEAEALIKGLTQLHYLPDRKSLVRHVAALRTHWGPCVDRKLGTSNQTIRRFLATIPAHRRSVVATGTTTNEALHRELNNVFDEVHEIHQATLDLKLKILIMGKGISHVRAAEGAAEADAICSCTE